jgi:hypothetical protein
MPDCELCEYLEDLLSYMDFATGLTLELSVSLRTSQAMYIYGFCSWPDLTIQISKRSLCYFYS